jgi:hypothetical protein
MARAIASLWRHGSTYAPYVKEMRDASIHTAMKRWHANSPLALTAREIRAACGDHGEELVGLVLYEAFPCLGILTRLDDLHSPPRHEEPSQNVLCRLAFLLSYCRHYLLVSDTFEPVGNIVTDGRIEENCILVDDHYARPKEVDVLKAFGFRQKHTTEKRRKKVVSNNWDN